MSLAAVLIAFLLSSWTACAIAQNTFGELLDAGATKLSPDEFRQEVMQRVIVGPTATGGTVELMYAGTGVIQGAGTSSALAGWSPLAGEWNADTEGRICTSMRIGGGPGTGPIMGTQLPPRCQFWYRKDGAFFFSDSDSDRSARVFRRTIKP